MFCVISVKR